METAFELQRWLYTGALDALKGLQTTGIAGLPLLLAAAFGFGLLHALLPGHGKSVLASYYAGHGRWTGALASSTILILTHVGSAIILVLAGFVVLQRTIGGAGRAPAIERASQVLLIIVGLWLLWRALRPHEHASGRSGPVVAFIAGLVPCPLTTFIMTYAVVNGVVGAGLFLSGAFAAGMIVTVFAFPLLAVLMREPLLRLIAGTEDWRTRLGRALEILVALSVIGLGLWPLAVR